MKKNLSIVKILSLSALIVSSCIPTQLFADSSSLLIPIQAAASHSLFANFTPEKACDGVTDNINNAWTTIVDTDNPQWIEYSFEQAVAVTQYKIYPRYTYSQEETPRSWQFEAWDGSCWVILDTQQNINGYTDGIGKEFLIDNTAAFSKYRLVFTETNRANSNWLNIGEIEMLGYTPSQEPQLIVPQTVEATYSMYKNFGPEQLFDGIKTEINNAWISNVSEGKAQSVSFHLNVPAAISKYTIYPRYDMNDFTPTDWTFEAWDGTNWIVLDSQQNITDWLKGQVDAGKTFNFENTTRYNSYRITFTKAHSTNPPYSDLELGEIEIFGR